MTLLDERHKRVAEDHERAIRLRNELASCAGSGHITTNRYPNSDVWHIEMDQEAARALLEALKAEL